MVYFHKPLIRLSCILLWLAIQQSWASSSSSIPKCTNSVCIDYTDDHQCPDVSNCTGIVLPSPTLCNCCEYCLDYIEEGGECSKGVPGQASIQMICGSQLACGDDNVCVKIESKCMNASTEFEEKWKDGSLGEGEIEPFCDDVGDYGHVQCIPGSICFCSSPAGDRIFGEMVNENVDMKTRMDCACSRDEWRARNRIKSMEKRSHKILMKSSFARCLPSGSYDVLQCVQSRCACVDEKGIPQPQDVGKKVEYVHRSTLMNGKPWCFNQTNYEPGTFDTPCLKEREKVLEMIHQLKVGEKGAVGSKSSAIVLGAEYVMPNCAPDGSYERVQQSWDKKSCVDPEGNLLKNQDAPYSVPLSSKAAEDMDCYCARTVYLLNEWVRKEAEEEEGSNKNGTNSIPPLIVSIPVCCPNGNFALWQCRHGECYCVDRNGAQISPSVLGEDVDSLPCYNGGKSCDSLEE